MRPDLCGLISEVGWNERLLLFLAFLFSGLFPRFFHLFLGSFHLLGARFRTLGTLLLNELLAAQQFDERLLPAVTLTEAGAHDAEVSAVAVAEARRDGIKQSLYGFARHKISARLTARR